jgi:hypothetical protein
VSASPAAGPAAKFAIVETKRATSLAKARQQRYVLTCSAAMTVQVRVAALITAGKKHLTLAARTLTLKCNAAKATEATASFKPTNAAKQLLSQHGASVKLSVRVYATGATAGTTLASATVRGRP